MMASQDCKTSIEEKLVILRKMVPSMCKSLVPTEFVPRLGALIPVDLRRDILEKEEAGRREEAAKLLLEKVIEEGERGMNVFLTVLQQEGNSPGWSNILKPLENIDGIDADDSANDYYEFIIHLLEGDIIDRLTDGHLQEILIHLESNEAINECESERIQSRYRSQGRFSAAVQMFTVLGMRDSQWPVKFFLALREANKKLYKKIAPFEDEPVVDKESSEMGGASGAMGSAPPVSLESEGAIARDSQEQTHPKQLLAPQAAGAELGSGLCEERAGEREDEVQERRGQPVGSAGGSDDACGDGGAAVSAPVADSDEDQRAGFSDDEKQDMEESEKTCQWGAPQAAAPRALELREYQRELARRALDGFNSIICAPTGSGKTRVALHIVQKHLEKQQEDCRVVFLAPTGPVVSQQYQNFKEYLPQYKCELVTGDSKNSMTVHHLLDKTHILVLTPKILENHLTPEKIPSLSAFSLIIFDECHNTRKGESYNSVMKRYLRCKKQGESGLPQIVGLTATFGVEKATTADEAKESILSIMSNLDVTMISQVRNHLNELWEKVPRPEEDQHTLTFRENDEISNTITNVMNKIVEELQGQQQRVKGDGEVDEVLQLLRKRETDLRSQKFGQWAVNLRNQARLLHRHQTRTDEREAKKISERQTFSWNVQVLADWLVTYNEAFDVHDLTCPEDVLHYLELKSVLQREEGTQFISTELDRRLRGYFADVQRRLKLSRGQKNPNLEKLEQVILSHIEEAEDDRDGFRILVFVKTRATCWALCRWLNSSDVDEELRQLNAQSLTGTGAHQEHGGMTAHDQDETLKRFKRGEVKLLVTTSVGEEGIDIAECNLTIRYNHVGNEVTTVQTRGRSRKRGGRTILMAMPKIIKQEDLNKEKEKLMHDALRLINAMPEKDIRDFVEKVQTKVLEEEDIDQIMKQVKELKKESDFSIACPQCYQVKVNGAQIRIVNNAHRVIIGHEIDQDVVIMPGKVTLKKDDWVMRGSVTCKCKNRLGQLLTHKKTNFILVSPKYWVFLDKDGTPSTYKEWGKVLYQIAEISPSDIKKHRGKEEDDDDADSEVGAATAVHMKRCSKE